MELGQNMPLTATIMIEACTDAAACGDVGFSDGASQTAVLDDTATETMDERWLTFPDIVCEEDDDDDYDDDDNVFDDDDDAEEDEEFEDDEFLDDDEDTDDEEGDGESEEDLEDDEL